jgi:hypothetical protein
VEKETKSECRFEVAQDPFNSLKMERGKPVHKLGDFVDCKGDARLSDCGRWRGQEGDPH